MIQFDNCVERHKTLILQELKDVNVVCWIAGGAVRDYFMGRGVKSDYDIFFPDEVNYNRASVMLKGLKAEVVWESENGMKLKYKDKKFDLVKKFFDSPQSTIDAFDFTVSMFAVDYNKVYHGETSFIDLSKRQLMINKITYAPSTLSRAFRYKEKGFNICQEELKKIILSIQKMGIPEPEPIIEVAEDERTTGDGFFRGID